MTSLQTYGRRGEVSVFCSPRRLSGAAAWNNLTAAHRPRGIHRISRSVQVSARALITLSAPEYTIQFNRTAACKLGAFLCDDPEMDVGLPAQVAVERALIEVAARRARSNPSLQVDLTPKYAEFPHPQFEGFQRDMAKIYGPQFFAVGVVFNFVFQLVQLVNEKELGLKLQMRMMGARDGPMWLSWLLLGLFTNIIIAFEFIVCLHAFDMPFVTRHEFGVYFGLFLLTYVANTSAACFWSAWYHQVASARSLASERR